MFWGSVKGLLGDEIKSRRNKITWKDYKIQ
jgi:hypothetical protein